MEPVRQIRTLWYNWGEWDGFYDWPAQSFRAGSNLETKQIENGACACSVLVDTLVSYTGNILSINKYRNRCFATLSWTTTKIYDWWVFEFNMASWDNTDNQVLWFWTLKRNADSITYSYWFSKTTFWVGKIHRFATDFTSATYNIKEFAIATPWVSTKNMTVLPVANRIIFSIWNTIFELSDLEVVKTLVILPNETSIIWITKYWDTYKVYYNWERYSWWPIDSYVAYWDWFDSAFDSLATYTNSPIRMVVSDDWAFDYVSFWWTYTSDLYYVWWLNRWKPIITNIEQSTWNTRVFWTIWAIREGIIYMVWVRKWTTWNDNTIYSYWNYYAGTNNQLVPENIGKRITWMAVNDQYLECYCDDDGKIYTKSFFFASAPEWTATIYTYPLLWNYWISSEKTISSIYIPYFLYNNSDHIKIYYRKDATPYDTNTDGRTLIKDITGADYKAKRGCIVHRSELSAISLWDFYMLEYKIEIVSTSTKSSILWQIKTAYLDNLKQ